MQTGSVHAMSITEVNPTLDTQPEAEIAFNILSAQRRKRADE
jgi:hypothetical protein